MISALVMLSTIVWSARLTTVVRSQATVYCYAQIEGVSLPLVDRADIVVESTGCAADCEQRCAVTAVCSAFTWANGICVLKPTYSNGVVVPGAVSGLVDKSKGDRCHGIPFFVDDALLVGGDLPEGNATAGAVDVAGCFFECAAKPPCDRFTWTRSDGGTCWLKDATTQGIVPLPGVQSGFILHPTARST